MPPLIKKKNAVLRFIFACCAAVCWFSAPTSAGASDKDPETPACTPQNLSAIELSLPNILARNIRSIPSTEGSAAARFLLDHPDIPLFITFDDRARAERLGRESYPGLLMAYDPYNARFHIAHRLLHLNNSDEALFVKSARAQRDLSRAVAYAFVHEVSHARVEREQPGMASLVEDELVAFYRSQLFLLDALKAEPGFDSLKECLSLLEQRTAIEDKLARLRSAGEAAPPALTKLSRELALVKERDRGVCTMPRLSALGLFMHLESSNAEFEALIRGKYAERPDTDADPAGQIAAAKKKLATLRSYTKEAAKPENQWVLRAYEGKLKFWSDPDKRRRAREYFKPLLAALRKEMAKRRSAGELKAFHAPANLKSAVSEMILK